MRESEILLGLHFTMIGCDAPGMANITLNSLILMTVFISTLFSFGTENRIPREEKSKMVPVENSLIGCLASKIKAGILTFIRFHCRRSCTDVLWLSG